MRFFDWVRRWPLWGFLGLAGGAIAFAWLSSKASTNQLREVVTERTGATFDHGFWGENRPARSTWPAEPSPRSIQKHFTNGRSSGRGATSA